MLRRVGCLVCVLVCIVSVVCGQTPTVDPCNQFADDVSCYTSAARSCVFQGGQCITDPCRNINDGPTCRSTLGCLSATWAANVSSTIFPCFSYRLICTQLTIDVCTKMSMCAIRSNAYCMYAVPEGDGVTGQSTSQCAPFPVWSIALIVVWVLIMIILIFIIVLILKKRNHVIKGIEREEIVIESVAIRDTFNPAAASLHQPLV